MYIFILIFIVKCVMSLVFYFLTLQRYVFFFIFPNIWQRCDKKNVFLSVFVATLWILLLEMLKN